MGALPREVRCRAGGRGRVKGSSSEREVFFGACYTVKKGLEYFAVMGHNCSYLDSTTKMYNIKYLIDDTSLIGLFN